MPSNYQRDKTVFVPAVKKETFHFQGDDPAYAIMGTFFCSNIFYLCKQFTLCT